MDLNRMWQRFIEDDDTEGHDGKYPVPSPSVFIILKENGNISPARDFFFRMNDGQVIITS